MKTQIANSSSPLLRQALRRLLLPAGALGMPALAMAGGPTGEVIVDGNAGVSRPDTNTTVIDQASWRAIIDWQSFNVGANEYVIFNQPGTSAVILNRVVGGDPTSILGSMTANGQVFLVNPQGVFFGQSATLDVGGLLATTLDISNADFMAGDYHFTKTAGAPDAGVVNEGSINADGGYVVLAADHVSNSGVVAARAGHVVMAAGSAFTLDVEGDGLVNFAVNEAALSEMAGVSNAGTILADGGVVLMTAKVANDLVATAVNNEGLIQAHSITEQDGVIYLAAEGGDIVNAGTMDADGAAGENGGHIRVLSDQDISLENGSVLTAQGDGAGTGGTIRVIAEDVLAVRETATVYAQGGAEGEGGFVEVSGHGDFLLAGDVRVGTGGLLLIDPTNVNIANNSDGPASYGSVGVGWIENHLDSGSDVLVVASNSITHDSAVTTLTATGTGSLNLAIGTIGGTHSTSGCFVGGVCTLPIDPLNSLNFGSGGTINLAGMDISIGGDFNATAQTGRVQLGNVATTGGSINIIGGLEIDTGTLNAAGSITLDATGVGFTTSDNGIQVNGNVAAGGDVTMLANGNTGELSYGGSNVEVFGAITAGGKLDVIVQGINTGSGAGIYIHGAVSASSIILDADNTVDGNVHVVDPTPGGSGGIIATTGDITITAPGSVGIASSAEGGLLAGSSVSAAGNVTITANGNILAGNVSAGGLVQLSAIGNSGSGIKIETGDITGASVDIYTENNNDYGGDAVIRVGNVTANTGSIHLTAQNNGTGASNIGGASIDAGKLTAATNVTVEAIADPGAGIGGHIITGAISGEEIYIHHNGNKADISIGSITAINTDGVARVDVSTGDYYTVTQAGNITINGDITVAGQAVDVSTGCGTGDSCLGAFDQPTAAQVRLQAGNYSNTVGGVITVNGGINITANAADVTVNRFTEGGPTTVAGTAGVAELFIRGAMADVSGSIALNGPDANMDVQADQVTLGAVSVTGSGHDMILTREFQFGSGGTLTSINNAGNAVLRITGYSDSAAAQSVDLAGAVTVSGIGTALVEIVSTNISTQTIDVTAAAANYDRDITGSVFSSSPGSVFDNNGDGPIEIDQGTITAGIARIRLTGGNISSGGSCSSGCALPVDQLTINGDLTANGVGVADIFVAATNLAITGDVTATAAAGTVDGAGQYFDSFGSSSFYTVDVTQQGDIGQARVQLLSDSGSITVGGDITVSGLVGNLDLSAKEGTLSVHGISVAGTGGVLHTTKEYTPSTSATGSSFTTSFEGPTDRTMVGIFGNQVTINGNVDVSGPGVVGLMIAAFSDAPVINGDISVSATSATVTELDTRESPTATVNTYGDVGIILGQFGSTETAIAPADINGSLTLTAARDAHLLLNADIRDELIVNAERHIDTVAPDIFEDPEDPDALPEVTLAVTAGGLGLTAGGNIDFGSGTLDVNSTQDIAVVAGGAVNFGNATLKTTQLLSVVAGGSISNGSGSFTADGLALISNASINMGSTTFDVGDGVFADIPGDALLLLGLSIEQLAPPSASPNATFVAADGVNIGALSVDGGYVWFETHEVTFNGAVTGPGNLLVQFTPFGGLGNVIINGDSGESGETKQAATGLNLSLGDLQAIQDGATIVIGTSEYTGAITIDAINIDGRNFVAATEGTIDSLENITSTGKVKNLNELLAVGLFEQPGLDEINADYYNSPLGDGSETGEEEGEDTDGDGIPDTEGGDALISHDSSGETKVCAG